MGSSHAVPGQSAAFLALGPSLLWDAGSEAAAFTFYSSLKNSDSVAPTGCWAACLSPADMACGGEGRCGAFLGWWLLTSPKAGGAGWAEGGRLFSLTSIYVLEQVQSDNLRPCKKPIRRRMVWHSRLPLECLCFAAAHPVGMGGGCSLTPSHPALLVSTAPRFNHCPDPPGVVRAGLGASGCG